MRWPWRRRPAAGPPKAVDTLAMAEEAVRQVDARWPEVRELAEQLRRRRRDNHFGPLIEAALRARYGKGGDGC